MSAVGDRSIEVLKAEYEEAAHRYGTLTEADNLIKALEERISELEAHIAKRNNDPQWDH